MVDFNAQGSSCNFPSGDGKVQKINLPEDVYVFTVCARKFGLRVLELKEQELVRRKLWLWLMYASCNFLLKQFSLFLFVSVLGTMEYRAGKKAKKQAYARLKQIARLQGKRPPPNPYPSAIKEIQAEERKYVRDRFFNPSILKMVQMLKEERAADFEDRRRGSGW
ncbi:uncharacterized protein LOC116131712 [Pistacia vera]|uniref:uncharacterized protein LOC116131712 n=1 Tax=Pistacia vera TaxID=55513 RepID=UPI00126325B3|nr:uncharacterized protein LOC116131712 [Pistacia vera]